MGFLTSLGEVINEQFSFGENTISSLDTNNGRTENYGLLGKFAGKIDQTAERSYVEDGFVRNVKPRLMEVFFQQPDITVIIKKKFFSSLVDNNRIDLLEDKERLLLKASKKLIQNKCRLISIYERLTKIEKITTECGQFNTLLAPMLLEGVDALSSLSGGLISSKTRASFNQLRRALAYSGLSDVTNYTTTEYDSIFASSLGDGPGTFELTTVASINTKVGTEFGSGSASLTIEDPYKLTLITPADIDQAISDSTNFFKASAFGSFVEVETENLIDTLKQELTVSRAERSVPLIYFKISANTLISKRVRAILDNGREIMFNYNPGLVGIGASVEIDSVFTGGSGNDIELTSNEEKLFKRIIESIFLLLGYKNTTQSKIREFNAETSYVRNRMRLLFSGKSIIQNMDVISIFMTSRTTEDLKLTEGFQNVFTSRDFAIGQKFDSITRNINSALQNLSGNNNRPEDLEKAAIVGADFPTWLWRLFRNDLTRQSAGTCIFTGLAGSVSRSYSDGKYVLTVPLEDNSGYFGKSQVNVKPAMDVYNSSIYDPLTPFDVSFDAATGVPITDVNLGNFPPLLPENSKLLNSKAVRFKNGRNRGQAVGQLLFKVSDEELAFNSFRKVLNDPDGFVYRWKQGIQALTKTERAFPQSSLQEERSPLLTKEPFAGQDVMNVLSLLITGEPYNFNTFLKAAISSGNGAVGNDPITGKPISTTYIESLTGDLSKKNAVWGGFVPFKKLTLSEDAISFIRTGQSDYITRQGDIWSKLRQEAKLQDDLMLSTIGFAGSPNAYATDSEGQAIPADPGNPVDTIYLTNLRRQIDDLQRQIGESQGSFKQSLGTISGKPGADISIIGNDISQNPSLGIDGNSLTETQRVFDREEFRKKIDFFTQRRLWKTRANEDPNYFIVDDQYDENFDIQAFGKGLSNNLNLLSSEYSTLEESIKHVSRLLGLEIFADSQGHIQVRPPGYNKMPSSVFYKMFQDRDRLGIKVFPEFLESLLTNQIKGIVNKLETVEDEIRLRATALGIGTQSDVSAADADIESALSGVGSFGRGDFSTAFVFVSESSTGKIVDFKLAAAQASPEVIFGNEEDPLKENLNNLGKLSQKISTSARARRLFDSAKTVDVFRNIKTTDLRASRITDRMSVIRERLEVKTGRKAKSFDDLFSNKRFKRIGDSVSQLDTLNIIEQISQYVSERQKLIISLSNAIKNLQEGLQVNSSDDGAKSALTPFLNRKNEIPSLLAHMIEDEDEDTLGPGSGRRFVLKDSQIVNLTISENPPPYTAVTVNGLFGDGFVDPPGGLQTSQDGNAVVSAYAVDYDLWYMYGFRAANSIPAPFFSDPDSQCAPYAVANLLLARQNILKGSVTVCAYNEFYQPGDVVYIEDSDLLFYVTSVSHSFSYNGSLNTTLELQYGHNPGEYLPTILDVVGKILYNSRGFTGQFRSSRFDAEDGDVSLGAFIVDYNEGGDFLTALLNGSFGEQNKKLMSNLLFAASGLLNPVGFRNKRPILELRYYGPGSLSTTVGNVADEIKKWLSNPQDFDTLNQSIIGENIKEGFEIPESQIAAPRLINIDDDGVESPSKAAWSLVRLMQENKKHGSFLSDPSTELDTLLFDHIIDAFITFEEVDNTTQITDGISQGAQEDAAAIQGAIRNS